MTMEKLYEYQQLREEYFKVKKILNDNTKRDELLAWKEKIEQINKEREELKKLLEEKQKIVQKINISFKDLESKENELKTQLYKGDVTNPKELIFMQRKLEEVSGHKENTKEEYILTDEEYKNLQKSYQAITNKLTIEFRPYQKETNEYKQNREINKFNLSDLASKIKEKEQEIDRELLDVYLKECQRLGNNVLVPVKGERCTGCNMDIYKIALNEIKVSNKVVRCENCDRILIRNF